MKNPGIYILTSPSGKQYVGRDVNLPSRVKKHLSGKDPECRHVHKAIKKHGADAFDVEIIQYPGISHETLNAVERWWVRRLQTLSPSGYNLTEGGDGGKHSDETRQKISESVSKQVADGTHNFLGGDVQRRANKKRLDEGTHNFLDKDFQRRTQKERVANGTHHFLGGKISRRTQKKRLEDGTHNFLGENHPNHKRIKNGTHHFLGESNPNYKRVADGTHHFLGGEVSQRTNKKRVEDGTHHFLGENNPIKRLAKEGRHPRTLKRLKGEWCYIIALSRFWYEIHDYTLKRRAEFLSKDIPDTSKAEQEYLF